MRLMLGTLSVPSIDYFAPENALFLEALDAFLKKEYSDENLNFLKAVKDLEGKSGEALQQGLATIYNQYIKKDAPTRINIAASELDDVLIKKFEANEFSDVSVLDKAVSDVSALMNTDSFSRFIKTQEYRELKQKHDRQQEKNKISEEIIEPLRAPIMPQGLGERESKFYNNIEPLLLAPVERAVEQFEIERTRVPDNPEAFTAAMVAVFKARQEASDIAAAAVRVAGATHSGTMEEAFNEREIYYSKIDKFILQETAATGETPALTEIKNEVTKLKRTAAGEKAAFQKLAEIQANSPPTPIQQAPQSPEPEPAKVSSQQPSKAKTGFREKLNRIKTKFYNPLKKNTKILEQRAVEKEAQEALEKQKVQAGILKEAMPTKLTQGLDDRAASDLFRPLSKAISHLDKLIQSPSATKTEIQEQMAKVSQERDNYMSNLETRFKAQEQVAEKRVIAAEKRVAANTEKLPDLNLSVSLLSDAQGNDGILNPSYLKPNTIYIDPQGNYIAQDKEEVIHKGTLKDITADDLENLPSKLNDESFKTKINTSYVKSENESNQNQALRIQSKVLQQREEAIKGQGIFTDFKRQTQAKAEQAKTTTQPTPPSAPSKGKKL